MGEFPFQLSIKCASTNKEESLTCTALLRVISGSRKVYEALWGGQDVIVKVFSHKIRARYHLKREWRGLSLLQKRGLSSPEPLFYGETEDRQWAVVVKRIADSSTALDVFNKTADVAKKLDLLVLVCKELAKQHSKAVLQKDFHLGNFLLRGDKVFALDPGQMRFLRHQVMRKKSISQLALLARNLPVSDTASVTRLCEEYFKARSWHFEKSDEVFFQKQLTAHRKGGVRKGLKKSLRTSKRHLRIKTESYLAVFDKGFCQGVEPLDFIKQIDELMNVGKILKNGNTCYVSGVRWNGKNIVVKRYNHKGFIHSLRHTIKKSRARRVWLHANRLGMLNIATPKPLAYIENRRGPLVWKSYLVTEYVEGQKLCNFLQNDSVTEQQRSKITGQITELLERLGKHRISHGDLKHSNILITANGPVLTDLDAMRAHKWNWSYKLRQTKDLKHFTNEGLDRYVSL